MAIRVCVLLALALPGPALALERGQGAVPNETYPGPSQTHASDWRLQAQCPSLPAAIRVRTDNDQRLTIESLEVGPAATPDRRLIELNAQLSAHRFHGNLRVECLPGLVTFKLETFEVSPPNTYARNTVLLRAAKGQVAVEQIRHST